MLEPLRGWIFAQLGAVSTANQPLVIRLELLRRGCDTRDELFPGLDIREVQLREPEPARHEVQVRVEEARDNEVSLLTAEIENRGVGPCRVGDGGEATDRQNAASFSDRDSLHPRYARIAGPERCVCVNPGVKPSPVPPKPSRTGVLRFIHQIRSGLLASVPEWACHPAPVRFAVRARDGPEDANREAERGERARHLTTGQATHHLRVRCSDDVFVGTHKVP